MEYCRRDPSYGGIDAYRRKNDSNIFGVPVKNIDYLFWNGNFCGICVYQKPFSEFEQLRDAIWKEFDAGKKSFTYQEYYVWEGEKTLMALEYNPVGERILFWMLGISILRDIEPSSSIRSKSPIEEGGNQAIPNKEVEE